MKKQQKNDELNFLYLDEKYIEKKPKIKDKRADKNSAPKKERKKSKNKKQAKEQTKEDVFNFNDEIVIGVTKINKDNIQKKETNKKQKNKKTKNNKKNRRIREDKKESKKDKKKSRKKTIIGKIIKWTILLIALLSAIIFFMMSPLFNIVDIEVINNNKISKETIISLSRIQLGENIYKNSKETITKNIKQNTYVDDVKITRKLPNKIEISIKERKPTYMIEYANSYIYINNQGYILEICKEPLKVPIIVGSTTNKDKINDLIRLEDDDLTRLEIVLKIMESATSNAIDDLITRIDVSDRQNYRLILEEEKKIVYIGDGSDLSNRMLYIKSILDAEKGIEGEIFVDGDLTKQKVFFRQKI